jgi:RHS repeat-associated protein
VQDNNETTGTTGDDLNYVYFYDANGNVGQVVDLAESSASASIRAKYEYDPYGKVVAQSGDYASTTGPANPFTFSTKYFDSETALGYWGFRYYSPKLGRWINRDAIEELGGNNVYAYVVNVPVGSIDYLGNLPCPADPPSPPPSPRPAPPKPHDLPNPPPRPNPNPPPPDPCAGKPPCKPGERRDAKCDCVPEPCMCKAQIKATGVHLYIHFEQTGCGQAKQTGNAHWGPCGAIGMCPCGSLNGKAHPPGGQGCIPGGSGWSDDGSAAQVSKGAQIFNPKPGDKNPCKCLIDIMDAKYGMYVITGPNSNSAAMEAARKCGLDTSGITGYPGQGISPGAPVQGGLGL